MRCVALFRRPVCERISPETPTRLDRRIPDPPVSNPNDRLILVVRLDATRRFRGRLIKLRGLPNSELRHRWYRRNYPF
jgi:hypothetical protein